ncbi:GTP 3',8-cyclase MoaA [bacterium]|nr:GTP 3',8-cyclase MoaA [bacterium]
MAATSLPTPAVSPLVDPFGRPVSYLRVSVTDRCDLRCVYCMAEDMSFLPKADVLTLRDIMRLIDGLGRHLNGGGLDELTLTTNGTMLFKYAKPLFAAGVRRINVSLDTLDPHKFAAITRWGKLDKIVEGIDAAHAAGLAIKINTVALKGVNDDELHRIVAWCGDRGYDLTFIEVMPMGELGEVSRLEQYLPLSMVRAELEKRWTLTESDHHSGGPARYVHVAETGRRVGFITPLTHNFCESCNRVRLTCTGRLYMCLGQEDQADLRTALRLSDDDELLTTAVREAITRKPKGHDFVIDRRHHLAAVPRHMSVTGG